ncbi:MAG: type IV pilus biogenesis/stability protein PilW [Chromatiales bacterium]|nr:type IV pilus biogenesis/stability protein PilW [Gammaproteobacteria bacterium]MBW6476477.1 type IV pilus biogenesis/stability protein PilW [Chromatiales bacterium]
MKLPLILLVVMVFGLAGCASSPDMRGVDKAQAADANAELGLRYMLQGDNQLAMEKLQRALEFDSRHSSAHHYTAELYRRLDRMSDADRHFALAVRHLKEPDATLHNNYGGFLCSRGRYDEGEAQFLKVLENPVYPFPDQVYENLGLCMEDKGDYAKAEAYLRQALNRNPRAPQALLGMARISFAQENYLSSRAYLQRYRDVAAHTPESLWLGVRTERMLGDRNALASYGLNLRRNFPDAEETRLYLESR